MSGVVSLGLIRADSTTKEIMYIASKFACTCMPQTASSAVYHML
jgi:hypothetical protein